MAITTDSLKRSFRENPVRILMGGLAVLVIGCSLFVGIRASAARAEFSGRMDPWRTTANQLATVQQQFRGPSSAEAAAFASEGARMGMLGVSPAARVELLRSIGQMVEDAGLSRVRVSPAPSDTAFLPERRIGDRILASAPYVVSVDFAGSFAGAVQFVSNLPPSVSVSQLKAIRRGGVATYQVILSVYQLDVEAPG